MNEVYLSVDGSTHQLFGDLLLNKIQKEGITSLSYSDLRFDHAGYGSYFPKKYPPLLQLLSAIISYSTGIPWHTANTVLILVCFLVMLYTLSKIVYEVYKSKMISFYCCLLWARLATADNALNEKGLSLFSAFMVGLQAQILFSTLIFIDFFFFLKKRDLSKKLNFFDLSVIFSLNLAIFYSNLLGVPYFFTKLIVLYLNRKRWLEFKKIFMTQFISLLFFLPWLIPFIKTSYLSPTLTTFLPINAHFPKETWGIWILFSFGLFFDLKKFTKIKLFILICLALSLGWTHFYEFFAKYEALSFLYRLPLQIPRYWTYLYLIMLVAGSSIVHKLYISLKDQISAGQRPRPQTLLLGTFPVLLLVWSYVTFSAYGTPFYLHPILNSHQADLASFLKEYQLSHFDYYQKFPIGMVAPGLYSKNDRDEMLPIVNIHSASMRYHLGVKSIPVSMVGYRENNIMQMLSLPLQNKLTDVNDIGLIHIPYMYNHLLGRVLKAKDFIELLKFYRVGFIICPREGKSGFCYDKTFQDETNVIYEKNFWKILVFKNTKIFKRKPVAIYTRLTTKYRQSASQLDYVSFLERATLANILPRMDLTLIPQNFSDQYKNCVMKNLDPETIILLDKVYKGEFEDWIQQKRWSQAWKVYLVDNVEDSLIFLKSTLAAQNSIEMTSKDLPLVYDREPSAFNSESHTYQIKAPFFEIPITCL
jgi:hypothetical protein